MPRLRVMEIQRSRLLAAAICAIEELGYAGTTVAQITHRARVSRRTFYELFNNREECLAAVLDDLVALVEVELAAANLEGLAWRERVRMGLWTILCFLDREPVLARVCVVHTLGGGPEVLARREAALARLVAAVHDGGLQGGCVTECTAMTAEGLVGAALAIVYGRLARGEREPLVELVGELTSMIVLPYQGAAAARREQQRAAPTSSPGAVRDPTKPAGAVGDLLDGVPMRLTYRTARVLEVIGERSGASNREVADQAGILDQGQVSKLLARLERLGLLTNRAGGHLKGEPNAWLLTTKGQLVTQSIRMRTPHQQQAA